MTKSIVILKKTEKFTKRGHDLIEEPQIKYGKFLEHKVLCVNLYIMNEVKFIAHFVPAFRKKRGSYFVADVLESL